jgi:two-component system chemotaxis sensor kinase CheA
MDASRYTALFLTESREQLAACGRALLEWERAPAAPEPVVALFRAMHTFKGMAAAMGYTNLTELAHRTETALARFRDEPAAGREHADLFFRVVDALEQAVEPAVAGQDAGLDFSALLAELAGAAAERGPAPTPQEVEAEPVAPVLRGGRRVRVTINPSATLRGARAFLALRKAEALGTVSGLRPPAAAFEQDVFDGVFSFRLETARPDAEIVAAIRSAGEVAQVEIEHPGAAPPVPEAAGRGRQIRVDLRRLDAMMKWVGELVVARSRLLELVEASGSPELEAVAARIARVTADLQNEVVQARLTPVWQVFDRFPRLVRDLARQLGKRVRFEIEGEEIELDRAILDELGEPLLHLLRNAVDHGIEPPEVRARSGKPVEGLVRLVASRDRDAVLIRVTDDGAGIDRAKVLGRAIRDGLVPKGTTNLSDDLLLQVLARPGFSTAERVTDVSGRGMGMDAVLVRVRALGGTLEFTTTPGVGSSFGLRLPMTLAIVPALVAQVGDERYAIPTARVAETVEFHPARVVAGDEGERFQLRDELLPTVRLRERLGVRGPRPPGRMPAVIVEVGERRSAVVVDALVGQQDIVVEPFDAPRGMLACVSGATILGDGVPALILDPAALV